MSSSPPWPDRAVIPNLLTVLRAILAFIFFVMLEFYRFPETGVLAANIALGLFVAAAATDAADGYLARRWKVESTFGRIMDPLCDKVLVIGAFVYLCGPRFVIPDWQSTLAPNEMSTGVWPWMVVVIISRELFVTTVRAVAEGSGVAFGAKGLGKMKMMLQSASIPAILALAVNVPADVSPWSGWVCLGLAWATVLATVISAVPYVRGIRLLNPARNSPP